MSTLTFFILLLVVSLVCFAIARKVRRHGKAFFISLGLFCFLVGLYGIFTYLI